MWSWPHTCKYNKNTQYNLYYNPPKDQYPRTATKFLIIRQNSLMWADRIKSTAEDWTCTDYSRWWSGRFCFYYYFPPFPCWFWRCRELWSQWNSKAGSVNVGLSGSTLGRPSSLDLSIQLWASISGHGNGDLQYPTLSQLPFPKA